MLSVINLILGEWVMVAWRNLSLIFLEISGEKHFFFYVELLARNQFLV